MTGGLSNLPPGCTNADIDRAFGGGDISPLEEEVLEVLERYKVPTSVNDRIMDILADWLVPEEPEPPEAGDDEPLEDM
jgi:hypothetical protein